MIITTSIDETALLLGQGRIIACPTETFYGLSAAIDKEDALKRIIDLKGRDSSKGMIVLVPDMDKAQQLAQIDEYQMKWLKRLWPGPLSAVLRSRPGGSALVCPQGRIALRISSDDTAKELVKKAGPITSTSANLAGHRPAETADDICRSGLKIDACLDRGKTKGKLPSTLVDLTVWPPVILRQGAIPEAEIYKRA
ncbi:MAG: L-threonylcarbamoyladenylate synthase [Thermodesulfobacteriota bacterium]|nr:L-threonylcarbamoyladenylate synthase [Thermodesulfobacteriota bacterium]